MGKLIELLKKLGNKNLIDRPDDGIPDYETRDRYLKSLRRQDRRIMDEKEKAFLKKKIAAHEKQRAAALLTSPSGLTNKKKRLTKKKPETFLGKGNMIKKSKL